MGYYGTSHFVQPIHEETVMMLHGIKFRLATSEDVLHLPTLLEEQPTKVLLRDMWRSDMECWSLHDVVKGPFWIDEDRVPLIMYGYDRKTGELGALRIVENSVLQYTNSRYPNWGMSPIALRLYIPADIPTSA